MIGPSMGATIRTHFPLVLYYLFLFATYYFVNSEHARETLWLQVVCAFIARPKMVLVVGVLMEKANLPVGRCTPRSSGSRIQCCFILDPELARGALASILMEKTNVEMAITRMRDFVQKMGSSSEDLEDGNLLRFLRAKSMNPEKAAKMFIEWEKWRAQVAPSGYVNEAEVPDLLGFKHVFLQPTTKDGHPLAVVHACKHVPIKDQLQLKKFVAYLFDKTIASSIKDKETGNEKIIFILDLQKIGLKNVKAQEFLIGCQILQSYYPGRLAKVYIISMPWIFRGIWKMMCAILGKGYIEKVIIVTNDDERRQMLEEIGEEGLPEIYGGLARLTPIKDVMLGHWPPNV